MTHPIENRKLHEDVKLKQAILGTKSGKLLVVFDVTNGRIVSFHTEIAFARESIS